MTALTAPESFEQTHVLAGEASDPFHLGICPSPHPLSKLSPAEVSSRPDGEEVVAVAAAADTKFIPTVTVSVAPATLVIPFPEAIVTVSPLEIDWGVPELPAKVN